VQLAHASSGYPITAIEIRAESEDLPPAYRLMPAHPAIRADSLGERLVQQLLLFSDEPANRNPMDVRLLTLGSQYALVFHERKAETIEGAVGFTADDAHDEPYVLGYQMDTEGLALDLATLSLDRLQLPERVVTQLRYTAARHAFITALTVHHNANMFAALRDTFKYSMAQALKQTAQEIAGVEALRYIGSYTKLHVDFGPRATDRIWLYEIGIGGIGVMRATHEAIRKEPETWLASCDTIAQRMQGPRRSQCLYNEFGLYHSDQHGRHHNGASC
jgi:hypothetical protein